MLTMIRPLSRLALGISAKLGWLGPLLVRLTVGLVFASTGWGKLHNLENVTEFFTSLGIPLPGVNAMFVSRIEFVGGLLVIAGLGTRIASALLVCVMAVAIWTAKLSELHGLIDLANTNEFMYLAAFAWLAVGGAGAISLDYLLVRADRGRQTDPRVGKAA